MENARCNELEEEISQHVCSLKTDQHRASFRNQRRDEDDEATTARTFSPSSKPSFRTASRAYGVCGRTKAD
ncbi:hypothetical protein PPTG_23437 [Phytophthora nicotianae INRA-310]|uniref:Uncharacterized protein n=2 Tax=Phytophthora nicotianae TaxID=4792 RepID=W2PZW1_PHYN3|nr:hypothetical protein PPTG_23437 [Phytophthora nicotianae INRA-310]ETN05784.1 hypothetical protein PPTG_23437 [Phytophthora nicotianae INRA-310]ETO70969.1 hypothetical protein F444_12611 [Phytophthora nicotianae P1976]